MGRHSARHWQVPSSRSAQRTCSTPLVPADRLGPTLGVDRSPYLAAGQALEPLGIGLVAALTALGRLED